MTKDKPEQLTIGFRISSLDGEKEYQATVLSKEEALERLLKEKEDLVYFLQKKLSDKDVELKQANNTIFYLIRALKNKDVSKREIDYLCDLGKYNLPISVIMEIINKKDMGFEDGIEQFRKYKD